MQSDRPRVCVALRWRESRSWEGGYHEGGATGKTTSSTSRPSEKSRLCVLRRRNDANGPPRLVAGGVQTDAKEDISQAAVVGLGMKAQQSASPPLQRQSSSRNIEIAVLTPFLAIEGFSAATSVPSYREADNDRRSSSAPSSLSDAHLVEKLSDVIAAELMGHTADASPALASASTIHGGRGQHREVLTFAMGLQGSGKTSFLLGNVQDGGLMSPPMQLPCPAPGPESAFAASSSLTSATGGLFRAVLDRLCAAKDTNGNFLSVAISVAEVRDAAPLRHPSVLQRPREMVDLLSGQLLLLQEAQTESCDRDDEKRSARRGSGCARDPSKMEKEDSYTGSDSPAASSAADEPTDIPAACYVRVESATEASRVLHTALLSSVAWQPCTDGGVAEAMHVSGGGVSTPSSPSLLRPAGLPQEEKTSHLCLTVLVGDGAAAATHPSRDASLRSVGIWKLWDVSGPSPSCGYRPYAVEADGHNSSSRKDAKTEEEACGQEEALRATLPWHSRYSLPSLTQTCLSAVTGCLDKPSASLAALLRNDAAALQIVSSATKSCSLVVPVCAVVDEAAADEVNAEVLRSSSEWAAYARRLDTSAEWRKRRTEGSSAAAENSKAAQRVLDDYAISFAELMRDRFPSHTRHHGGPFAPPRVASLAHHSSLNEATSTVGQTASDAPMTRERASLTAEVGAAEDTTAPLAYAATGGGTAPLSINVTAFEEEDQTAALRLCARRKDTGSCHPSIDDAATAASAPPREAVLAKLVHTPPPRETEEHSLQAQSTTAITDESAGAAAAKKFSVAATHAVGAVESEAEEVRPRRFQDLLDTVSFIVSDKPLWTSHEVEILGGSNGVAGVHDSDQGQLAKLQQQELHTPVKNAGSPPSVMYTGLRAPPSASRAAETHREATAAAAPPSRLLYTPSPLSSKVGTVVRDRQTLQHDASTLPSVPVAEMGGPAAPDNTNQDVENTQTTEPVTAAIVQYVKPYCDQFIELYDEMRRDVAAWRAAEAESLSALSALAEQHTRDIQQLTGALRGGASSPARQTGFDGVVMSSVPETAGAFDSSASAFAATSALIFEQLVKSEEKVTWLEKQLVQWRQRTREASELQYSNLDEGEGAAALVQLSRSGEADELSIDVSGVNAGHDASAFSDTISLGSGGGDKADPTRRHVLQAQRILHRLLQRCGRAYASAQRRGTRWQEQLAQEQAARSALMDRVRELESELASCRHRRATWASPNHQCPADLLVPEVFAPPSTSPLSRSGAATAGRKDGEDGEAVTTIHMSFQEQMDPSSAGHAASVCATPAPASPIRSSDDTALSLPSQPSQPDERRRRSSVWPRRAASAPEHDLPMLSSAASSIPSSIAVVPAELAAMLSRAVNGGERGKRAASNNNSPAAALPSSMTETAGLFEIHVGRASSAANTAERMGTSSEGSNNSINNSVNNSSSSDGDDDKTKHRRVLPGCHVAPSLSSKPRSWKPTESCSEVRQGNHNDDDRASPPPQPQHTRRSVTSVFSAPACGPLIQRDKDVEAAGDDDTASYPTAALKRLQQAAAHLAVNAVQLTRLGSARGDSEGDTVDSAASRLRQTLKEPVRRALQVRGRNQEAEALSGMKGKRWKEDGDNEGSCAETPLYYAIDRLRSASQAVQREAREAAEREKAYLSTILFSPDSSPHLRR